MHRIVSIAGCLTLILGLTPLIAPAQERQAQGNVLISTAEPRLALRIGETFDDAGQHDFDIRGLAGGTRYVWVETEGSAVRRMFIVQLEGFYPDSGGQYHYDLSASPEVAGYRWRSNGYAFDLARARLDEPGNESSVTAEFLAAQGYTLPDIILMWRSLTVVNAARTHEAILFLFESGDQHGLTLSDLYQDDEDTVRWREIQAQMERDFHELVEISPLDANGQPVGPWHRIPANIWGQ